jgi:uncharacterized protein (UPF0248 family)
MRAVVERVRSEVGARLEEKDVRDDPALEARYVFEIPVLLLGEREIARHRVTENELRRLLREAGLGPPKSG